MQNYSIDLFLTKWHTEMTPNDTLLLALTIKKLSKWLIWISRLYVWVNCLPKKDDPGWFSWLILKTTTTLGQITFKNDPATPWKLLNKSKNCWNGSCYLYNAPLGQSKLIKHKCGSSSLVRWCKTTVLIYFWPHYPPKWPLLISYCLPQQSRNYL